MSFILWKQIEYRAYQKEIVDLVMQTSENLGIILPPGTGKTIISLILADKYYDLGKILILVPTRDLGQQHYNSIEKYTSLPLQRVFMISGEIKPSDREILWKKGQLFISLAETVKNDMRHGRIDMSEFSLVIIDEIHKAGWQGNHAAITITNVLWYLNKYNFRKKIRIIGLTATPGHKLEKIVSLFNQLSLTKWIMRDKKDKGVRKKVYFRDFIPKPVEMTADLIRYEVIIREQLDELARIFFRQGLIADEKQVLSIKKIKTLQRSIMDKKLNKKDKWTLLSFWAEYLELRHILNLLITESFYAAFQYIKSLQLKLSEKKCSKSIKRIFSKPRLVAVFQEIADKVGNNWLHPKVKKLIEVLSNLLFDFESSEAKAKQRILVFGNNIETLKGLHNTLEKNQLFKGLSAVVHSVNKKADIKAKHEKVQAFISDEAHDCILLATSVLEQGMHFEQLDYVVNFSMPLDELSKTQRDGRTGRKRRGCVINLIMNHPFDENLHYANCSKTKNMNKTIRFLADPKMEIKIVKKAKIFSDDKSNFVQQVLF